MNKELLCRGCRQRFIVKPEEKDIVWIREPEKKNRYFHKRCWEEFIGLIYREDDHIENNYDYYIDKITNYITYTLKSDYEYFQIKKQLSTMVGSTTHTKSPITMKGVYWSLEYYFGVLNNPWKAEYGIGIIPHIYEQATDYWAKQIEKNKDILAQITMMRAVETQERRQVKLQEKKKRNEIKSPF